MRRPVTGSHRRTAAVLAPQNGRGVSVVIYDTEDEARAVAARTEVGKPPPFPDPPAGLTVRTVEVREVLASL